MSEVTSGAVKKFAKHRGVIGTVFAVLGIVMGYTGSTVSLPSIKVEVTNWPESTFWELDKDDVVFQVPKIEQGEEMSKEDVDRYIRRK